MVEQGICNVERLLIDFLCRESPLEIEEVCMLNGME